MVKVKICGITNIEDAVAAIEAGADMVGFVFAPSPRRLLPEKAAEITSKLNSPVIKVGVFVDSELDFVQETMRICRLDKAQLHGSESPEYCQALGLPVIKAFRVRDSSFLGSLPLYKAEAYLLDSYDPERAGGTGKTFNWDIARDTKKYGKIILSGGLTPENVRQAVFKVEPYGVDVSSGVELGPGKKDHKKVKAFIGAARQVSSQ